MTPPLASLVGERDKQADRIEELEAKLAKAVEKKKVLKGMANDRITHHAKRWLNGPMPADLMADLADIVEDDDYPPEKRAHQVVWQALKWMMENPVPERGQSNE